MLNSNYYSIKNALNYQIFTGHVKEALGQGKLGHRVVHLIIVALEITPIIGQIIALFELAIVKAFGLNTATAKPITPIKAITTTSAANTLLLPFYQGIGKDCEGRTLQDIWKFNDDQLEDNHDYIQWLFPSMKPSAHNPNAPVLGNAKGPNGNESLLEALKKDPKVRANLENSFDVMLKFYGLRYDPKAKLILTNPNFDVRMGVWVTPGNHNFLRITRILSCLKHFGMHDRSKAFFDFLVSMRWSQKSQAITGDTVKRWSQACGADLKKKFVIRGSADLNAGTSTKSKLALIAAGIFTLCSAYIILEGGSFLHPLKTLSENVSVCFHKFRQIKEGFDYDPFCVELLNAHALNPYLNIREPCTSLFSCNFSGPTILNLQKTLPVDEIINVSKKLLSNMTLTTITDRCLWSVRLCLRHLRFMQEEEIALIMRLSGVQV